MASVYKRTKYAPIPANAVVEEQPTKGGTLRRIAKWTDANGVQQQADVESDKRYGDRIVIGEFRNWYISYESEHGRKQTKGYSDKAASIALGERLEKEAARRREGLIDSYDDHMKTPIGRHLDDFIATRPTHATSQRYVEQVRTRIERVIKGVGATRFHELDPVAIDRFLNEQGIVGYTRNEYVGNLKAFVRWGVESKRLREDPLASLRKTPRKKIRAVHPRRALRPGEVAQLLDATVQRPLLEKMIVRTGKDRGKPVAQVHPRVRAKMERLGFERKLCYLIAVWAGLRRSEIRSLQWGDIHLDAPVPYIQLRAEATKAKRADGLAIHPQLLDVLRKAKGANAAAGDRVVGTVPDMKTVRADLALAGIEGDNKERGFVDFHSLRKTLSTMMAAAKMSQRARQSHMRHTDPRLTENTYMDERLLPVAEELARVPAIPPMGTPALTDTGTPQADPLGAAPGAARAADLHRKTAIMTLDLTSSDNASQEPIVELLVRGPLSQVLQIQRLGQVLTLNDKTPHREARGLF